MSRKPSDALHRKILDVAGGLYYERGIGNVGINEIIARTGIAKRTLYKHFASRDDLVRDALRGTYRQWLTWFERRVHVTDEFSRLKVRESSEDFGRADPTARAADAKVQIGRTSATLLCRCVESSRTCFESVVTWCDQLITECFESARLAVRRVGRGHHRPGGV